MADLYEDDILLWSERQAELLRRRAAGELVNDAELDWPNIAEEIEDVGKSQRTAVQSLLQRPGLTPGGMGPPLPSALALAGLEGSLAGKVHALGSDPGDGLAAALARLGRSVLGRNP